MKSILIPIVYQLVMILIYSNNYQFCQKLVYFCFQIFTNIAKKWQIFDFMKKREKLKLVTFFKDKSIFSRKDLFNYFLQTEGELKAGTFGWRIYDLKKNNVLREIKRGWYTLKIKPTYAPPFNEKIEKLATIFTSNYREAKYCVWDINWINEFTVHQFSRDTYLLETEKDLEESVAHTLSENGFNNILWSLKGTHLSITNSVDPVVILPLKSRSPVQYIKTEKGKKIAFPTLEKLLVDIYEENKIFHFIQGAEMERIFQNALNRYSINYTTFFGYAKRRGKEINLRAFFSKYFPELLKNINR